MLNFRKLVTSAGIVLYTFGIKVLSFFKLRCFQRAEFDQFAEWPNMPHSSPILWKWLFSILRNPFYTFLIGLLAERKFIDCLSSWGTESAIHQANLCIGEWVLKLWIRWWKSWFIALIVCQNIFPSSWTVRITKLWPVERARFEKICSQLGYATTCPQPWSRNCVNFA